jgi:hypothetical protein
MEAILLSLALGYYTYHYGDKPWSFVSFVISFFVLVPVISVLRSAIWFGLTFLVLVMLDIEAARDDEQLFYFQNFWIDIIPMIIDLALIFYFSIQIPKKE